jgi:hypothetical protein
MLTPVFEKNSQRKTLRRREKFRTKLTPLAVLVFIDVFLIIQ